MLVQGVSQSVVQVLVTSYGPVDDAGRTNTDLVIGRQRRMGSGVVIDAGGYIVTNAHVVSNARRVEVVLPGAASREGGVHSLVNGRGRFHEWRFTCSRTAPATRSASGCVAGRICSPPT
jgi:S1-C subfamily serine protease